MKNGKILWGVIFVIAGITLILGNLGYMGDVNFVSLTLSIILVAVSIKSIISRNFYGTFIPLALIGILFDKELGIEAITPWTILIAALLLSIGFSMIFSKKKSKHKYNKNKIPNFTEEDINDESYVNFETAFTGSAKYIKSTDFKQGTFECSFGSMKIYFDNAIIKDEMAFIDLEASFSGVELYIPKEWSVRNDLDVSMGKVEEENNSVSTGSPVIVLRGDVSFSSVDIIYV